MNDVDHYNKVCKNQDFLFIIEKMKSSWGKLEAHLTFNKYSHRAGYVSEKGQQTIT